MNKKMNKKNLWLFFERIIIACGMLYSDILLIKIFSYFTFFIDIYKIYLLYLQEKDTEQ